MGAPLIVVLINANRLDVILPGVKFGLLLRKKGNYMNIIRRQKGVILIATMLMVSILAGLAATLSLAPITDQRAAANTADQQLAKQSMDSAIVQARQWLIWNWANTATMPVSAACPSFPYPSGALLPILGTTFNIDTYNTKPITDAFWNNGCPSAKSPAGVAQAAKFVIKYLGYNQRDNVDLFKIVAIGVGKTTDTTVYGERTIKYYSGGNGNVNASTPGAIQITMSHGNMYAYGASAQNRYVQRKGSTGVNLGGWGWGCVEGWCIWGCSGWMTCERDGGNRLRVSAASGSDNPACTFRLGPWVNCPGGKSSVQVPSGTSRCGGSPQTMYCSC